MFHEDGGYSVPREAPGYDEPDFDPADLPDYNDREDDTEEPENL